MESPPGRPARPPSSAAAVSRSFRRHVADRCGWQISRRAARCLGLAAAAAVGFALAERLPGGFVGVSQPGLSSGRRGLAERLATKLEGAVPTVAAEAEEESSFSLGSLATIFCALLLLVGSPPSVNAAKQDVVDENNWSPAPDLVPEMPPPLSAEEALRRHTTPSEEVKTEQWFKSGYRAYKSTCFGCHVMDPVSSAKQVTLLGESGKLTKELLERTGYDDPKRLQFIIRYGKEPKMPGYAADCTDYGQISHCTGVLTEQQLADVQDFVYNRANDGWKPIPGLR
eukprot:TRINITY_DN54904_c0_g1_i1.p1 TRINITY_DN54904_c0_g1~~TRINITY_DN54904_c0_g1_i1.p1  ORF type:complete len:284 (+),score=69.00 TRINITY_DN54904_c0_g1_i1:63-914(+)